MQSCMFFSTQDQLFLCSNSCLPGFSTLLCFFFFSNLMFAVYVVLLIPFFSLIINFIIIQYVYLLIYYSPNVQTCLGKNRDDLWAYSMCETAKHAAGSKRSSGLQVIYGTKIKNRKKLCVRWHPCCC